MSLSHAHYIPMDLISSAPIALIGSAAVAILLITMRACGALLTGIAIGAALMLVLTNPQLASRGRAAVVALTGYLTPDDSTAGRLKARLQQYL